MAKEAASCRKADPGNPKEIGAPMPGKVFKLLAKAGDQVKAGDTLLATEAMKMETNIKAREDGKIADILVKEGAQVKQGDLLIILE
jgi:pyruvate carboxylase